MNQQSAEAFAKWLANDQPELFVALYRKAIPAPIVKSLADFSDVLSSIGTGLSAAVSAVGSYVASPQGAQTLGTLGAAYLASKASGQAVQTNYTRAAAGLAPAPIQTIYNPNTMQYEAVLPQANGSYMPLSQANVMPSAFAQIPIWVYFAGGGLLLVMLMMSMRR